MFGIVFGFLLQKGGVGKYEVLMGQFFLTDFTVMNIMLTAIVVGMLVVKIPTYSLIGLFYFYI